MLDRELYRRFNHDVNTCIIQMALFNEKNMYLYILHIHSSLIEVICVWLLNFLQESEYNNKYTDQWLLSLFTKGIAKKDKTGGLYKLFKIKLT